MRLGIVGGALQGMEAAYLAKKAGIRTVLIDRDPRAPAFSIANDKKVLDVTRDNEIAKEILWSCDAILPASKDMETLEALADIMRRSGVPIIHDHRAFRISSSKILSNKMMRSLGLPIPRPYPECGFPVIVKPSGESGSVGVSRADDLRQLERGIKNARKYNNGVVVQEFVSGPSVSIEVIGDGDEAVPLVSTQLLFDDRYDCKMVISPPEGVEFEETSLRVSAHKLATKMHLHGVMDLEAIVESKVPKIIEINAGFPSQTPTAILYSHGVNMIKMLAQLFVKGELQVPDLNKGRVVIYEHVLVDGTCLRSKGEGMLTSFPDMRIAEGLFGSDEMITDYEPGKETWAATIICCGSTIDEAQRKRRACLDNIMTSANIETYLDPVPEERSA